ncbi:MAG: NnrS family protein [Burkholderiales bacterium]|nr:NnrS family protein [Burkholderiales bacterium]
MTADGARGARVPGNAVFFPAAAAYGMLVLPAFVLSLLGYVPAPPGLATPAGHAHEMLFGFALGVIAGNQLGPVTARHLVLLFGLWASARVAFLVAPQSIAAMATNIGFATLLVFQLAPRLAGSAKKWRNQALPIVLTAICGSAIALQVALHAGAGAAAHAVLGVSIPLVSLLMLFMGGRLIAPTVAGQFHRQGERLEARVQPRLEGGLIVTMAIAAASAPFADRPWGAGIGASAMVAASALATARLLRWRLWALRGRPDLLCLAAGYAWLAIGLAFYGIALAAGRYLAPALHVITAGSLGTLTLNVMAMTRLLKARKDPSRARLPVWGTLLVGGAAMARVTSGLGVGDTHVMLLVASLCWSLAFALLLWLLVRVR